MIGRRFPLALVVVAAAAAVHAPSLRGGFHYDDEAVILLNRRNLRDPGTIPRFLEEPDLFSGVPRNGLFRPVTYATEVVDATVGAWPEDGAPDPFPWHLTNLLLHAACAGALFHLLRRILRAWWGEDAPFGERAPDGASVAALLGALWFGLQPVNSEVVNYVSSRSESLAALFFVLSLWMHHAAWDGGRTAGRRSLLMAGSLAAGALSFGSKETGALLPAVAGALELWGRGGGEPVRERLRRGVLRALPLAALLGGYLLLRRHAMAVATVDLAARPEMTGAGVDPLMGGGRTMTAHLLTQARVAAAYALLLLFPVDLAPDHGVRVAAALDGPTIAALLAMVAGLGLVLRATLRGCREAPLVAAWAACAAAPSVLVPLNVVMNEHRLYLPATGLALGAGVLLYRALGVARRAGAVAAGTAALGLMFGVFAVVDVSRAGAWAGPLELWGRAVETSPSSWRAHMHLGVAHYRLGEELVGAADGSRRSGDPMEAQFFERMGYDSLDRALEEFGAARVIYPGSFDVSLNLGFLHLLRGRILNRDASTEEPPPRPEEFREAVEWFTRAEEASPGSFRALYNRATAMAEGGMLEEATAEFERLAQDRSRTTMYAYPLATLYRRAGRFEDALAQLDLIESIAPKDAGLVALKRGEVLTQAGRFAEAEHQLARAADLLGNGDPGPPLYMARLLVATGDERNHDAARVLWKAALDRGYTPGPRDRPLVEALR